METSHVFKVVNNVSSNFSNVALQRIDQAKRGLTFTLLDAHTTVATH